MLVNFLLFQVFFFRALPRISVKDVANRLYRAKIGNREVENLGVGFDDGSVFRNPKKDHREDAKGRKREKPSPFIHNNLDNFAILIFRAFAIDSWSSDRLNSTLARKWVNSNPDLT